MHWRTHILYVRKWNVATFFNIGRIDCVNKFATATEWIERIARYELVLLRNAGRKKNCAASADAVMTLGVSRPAANGIERRPYVEITFCLKKAKTIYEFCFGYNLKYFKKIFFI